MVEHSQQMARFEGIHLCHPRAPVLLSEQSLFVAIHHLSWLKEAGTSILPSRAAAPSSHISAHVWDGGAHSGSSLSKLCLASVLELCRGSRSAQPLPGLWGLCAVLQ